MKLSRSSVRTMAAALVLVCFLAWVTPAFAALEDRPSGTSSTNPDAGEGEWRGGWGSDLYPQFTVSSIPSDPGSPTTGFLYRIARMPLTPDPILSEKVGVSWTPEGAMVSKVYNLSGIYSMLPDAERAYAGIPGEVLHTTLPTPVIHDPREGWWYISWRFYNDDRLASESTATGFGIDMTPPAKPIGFTSGVSSVTESTRRNYTFLNAEYDELSGSYYYNVYLRRPNGTLTTVIQKHIPDWLPGKFTIEDLEPGTNQVGISVTDRANNEGPIVWHTDKVDPDVPSLAITYPAAGAWIGGTKTFGATASDKAGYPTVTFKVDGTVKGTDPTPSYQCSVDTKKLSAGGHTLSVTSKDLYGHTRTQTRTFYVDNTPIGLSSMSVTPNPFYPVRHDGYKDTATMKVHLNEAASEAYLEVYNSGGSLVRKYKKTGVGAGTLSMTWDGKDSGGGVSTGTFWFRFVVKDRAGNLTRTGMNSVIIRDYEVVRVGPDTVRVVPR